MRAEIATAPASTGDGDHQRHGDTLHREVIERGVVAVNGEVDTRRGRQVRAGDVVTYEDETLHVTANPLTPTAPEEPTDAARSGERTASGSCGVRRQAARRGSASVAVPVAVAAAASGSSSSGFSTTRVSVVSSMPAIEAALTQRRAGHLDRVDDALGDQVAVLAGGGVEAVADAELADLGDDDVALDAAVLGDPAQRLVERPCARCATPIASSPVRPRSPSSTATAWTSAEPPPATMPSSIAARVAETASSMRCFFSLSSTSVAAPTLMTQTPPASLARRSWSFSRSQSESVVSISALIWLTRPSTSACVAAAVDDRGVVLGDDDAAGRCRAPRGRPGRA